MKLKPTKYSTYYSSRIGIAILVMVFLLTGWGAWTKVIDKSNFVALITSYLITSTAFFGINLTRRTLEGINGVDGQVNSSTPVIIPEDAHVVVPEGSRVVDTSDSSESKDGMG